MPRPTPGSAASSTSSSRSCGSSSRSLPCPRLSRSCRRRRPCRRRWAWRSPCGARRLRSCPARPGGALRRSSSRSASFPLARALPWCVSCLVQILARFPVGKLPLRLVLADAVGVLDLADQLVALACDLVELVVGQLAPLLLQLALGLLPVSCDAVPVHVLVPRCSGWGMRDIPCKGYAHAVEPTTGRAAQALSR